jgi:hypothetical protein
VNYVIAYAAVGMVSASRRRVCRSAGAGDMPLDIRDAVVDRPQQPVVVPGHLDSGPRVEPDRKFRWSIESMSI